MPGGALMILIVTLHVTVSRGASVTSSSVKKAGVYILQRFFSLARYNECVWSRTFLDLDSVHSLALAWPV